MCPSSANFHLCASCRRFSQQIRQVLARGEGALAEARAACYSQMDEAHAALASDAEFRAECVPVLPELFGACDNGPMSAHQAWLALAPQM